MKHAAVRRIAGNALWSALAHVMMRGGIVVAFMLLSHRLGTADFAALGYFNIALNYVSALALVGLSSLIVRHFAAGGGHSAPGRLGAMAAILAVLSMLVAAGSALSGAPSVADSPPWLFPAIILVVMLGALPIGALNGLQRFRAVAVAAIVAAAVILVGALVNAGSGRAALAALVGAYAVKSAIEAIAAWRAARALKLSIAWPDRDDLRAVLADMTVMGLASLINPLGTLWLTTVVRQHSADIAFAHFAIGMQWYAIGAFLAANLTRAAMPVQVQLASERAPIGEARRLVAVTTALAVGGCLLVGLAALATKSWWIGFYDASLDQLPQVIPAFLLAAATVAPLNILGNQAIARHQHGAYLAASVAWLVVIVAAMRPALDGGGMLAVAGVMSAANLINGAVMLVALRRGASL